MRKEVLIAITLGLSLGLIVTYGIYTARKTFLPERATDSAETELTESPQLKTTASATPNSLVVLSPEDESVQATKEVKIVGTTTANVVVVIFINNSPVISRADSSGNFSVSANLNPGGNIITIKAINSDGTMVEEVRTVAYSTVSLEAAPAASASATPSATPKPKVTPKPTPKL